MYTFRPGEKIIGLTLSGVYLKRVEHTVASKASAVHVIKGYFNPEKYTT